MNDLLFLGSALIFIIIPIIIPLVMWQFMGIKDSGFYRYARIMRKILAAIVGMQVISVILRTSDWNSFTQIFGIVLAKIIFVYCLLKDWSKIFAKNNQELS